MNIDFILNVLIVLGLANGAPILAARIFGEWFATPVDAGSIASDGHPWLGDSKTWRGIVAAYLLGLPMALWLGFAWSEAFVMIGLSMSGDLCSSFIKRRRGMVSSSRAIGLDQIPEAGLPVLYLWITQRLALMDGVIIVLLFIVVEIIVSKILFQLHIRKRPY